MMRCGVSLLPLPVLFVITNGVTLGHVASDKRMRAGRESANVTVTQPTTDLSLPLSSVRIQKTRPNQTASEVAPKFGDTKRWTVLWHHISQKAVGATQRWAVLWHHISQKALDQCSGRAALALMFVAFLVIVGLLPSETVSGQVRKCLPSKSAGSDGAAKQLKRSSSMNGVSRKYERIKRSSSAYGFLAQAVTAWIKKNFSHNNLLQGF